MLKKEEINYELSTDYGKLYKLLKDNKNIVVFHSTNNIHGISPIWFDLGFFYFDEKESKFEFSFGFLLDGSVSDFENICKKYNVGFLDIGTNINHIEVANFS